MTAGYQALFRIQAADAFNNAAVTTDQMFALQVENTGTGEVIWADIEYRFSLYEAKFTIQEAGSYEAMIELTQFGGLVATYYKTVDFQSSVGLLNHYDTAGSMYTQIDSIVDFDLGHDPMITAVSFPTRYFSVSWEGFLLSPSTETFRLQVLTQNSSYVELTLDDNVLIFSDFGNSEGLYTDVDLV